jgi:hypothetical protein
MDVGKVNPGRLKPLPDEEEPPRPGMSEARAPRPDEVEEPPPPRIGKIEARAPRPDEVEEPPPPR